MVDEKEILKQYSYKATSNLVISQNRSHRQVAVPGVAALHSSSLPGRMGDRAKPSDPVPPSTSKIPAGSVHFSSPKHIPSNVLEAVDNLELPSEGLYRPTTFFSKRAYEALLSFISAKVGDQPRDVIQNVAEELLSTVKDEALTPIQRNENLSSIFSHPLTDDEVTRIGAISRGIRDYGESADKDESVLGFAVDFDDEEENAEPAVSNVVVDPEPDAMTEAGNTSLKEATADSEENPQPSEPLGVDSTTVDSIKWLRSMLSSHSSVKSAGDVEQHIDSIFKALIANDSDRLTEDHLVHILGLDHLDLISSLMAHKQNIIDDYISRESSSSTKSKTPKPQGNGRAEEQGKGRNRPRKRPRSSKHDKTGRSHSYSEIDLEAFSTSSTRALVSGRKFSLPEGSHHIENRDYEEWHIPPSSHTHDIEASKLIQVNTLPEWAQGAFPSTNSFNRMQSKVFKAAFETRNNLLICAPTGAGKTNVAVLTVLKALKDTGMVNELHPPSATAFKVVYVAPMKALVAEVVNNLKKRLQPLHIAVRELTGDINLSSAEFSHTHVIVTTPEKWDIISRKHSCSGVLDLELLIVDEIHLLHDDRGPVLESIIARLKTLLESNLMKTRIVGLSATLPNPQSVASFLGVTSDGLFHFDSSFRPCPLHQHFVGITSRRALKRFQLQNELTYEKVKLQIASGNQVIVFVHSRKETFNTCRFIIEKSMDDEITDQLLQPTSGSYEVIQQEIAGVKSKELADVLEQGLATHHAGLTRSDRELVEALFQNGHIKVLVSTATLAWGVNLPAHAVIIKGTQVYSPEHGRWVALSPMDVLQMIGRAGRPQFDTFGEGIIITSKADVMYYLSLMNNQLSIESQLITRVVDLVNAEVAAGSVTSISEGCDWLKRTYFNVRMTEDPISYGITEGASGKEKSLDVRRECLIHSSFMELSRSGMATYDEGAGEIISTSLGRIGADFYVGYKTMQRFTESLASAVSEVDLLTVFCAAGEFRHIRVREEEKLELSRLAERVPIPINGGLQEPSSKVNILLQAYISGLALDGMALKADMSYITQSAARLTRALLQIALDLKKANTFGKCLNIAKAVSARQWTSQTPLRQFSSLDPMVLHKMERKDIPFERYYDLSIGEFGELVKNPMLGKRLYKLVHNLPRLHVDAEIRPLTCAVVRLHLSITPDFLFDKSLHGHSQWFWVIVEDSDSESILQAKRFQTTPSSSRTAQKLSMTIELLSPPSPYFLVRTLSDDWIVPDVTVPVILQDMILPDKGDSFIAADEINPLSVKKAFEVNPHHTTESHEQIEASHEVLSRLATFYRDRSKYFPPVVAASFQALFCSDGNFVVSSLPNIDRDVCGELAIARLYCRTQALNVVWIVSQGQYAMKRVVKWLSSGIGKCLGLKVALLLQDRAEDISVLREPGVISITNAETWDKITRRWRQKKEKKIIRRIGLIVVDGLQPEASEGSIGTPIEVVLSRLRYMTTNSDDNPYQVRILALIDPVANARDIGQWIGASAKSVLPFSLPSLLKRVSFKTVAVPPKGSRHDYALSLSRTIRNVSRSMAPQNIVVFTSSVTMAELLASKLIQFTRKMVVRESIRSRRAAFAAKASGMKLCDVLEHGVCYVHEKMDTHDSTAVLSCFREALCTFLVTTCRFASSTDELRGSSVIIAGTAYESRSGLSVQRQEYTSQDLLRMLSIASVGEVMNPQVVIITDPPMRHFYERELFRVYPAESSLVSSLADHLNAEIASKVIQTKQDAVDYLTWTFFYRRLPKNPNFYGLSDLSTESISAHLSELVETALNDLEKSKCIAVEGNNDVSLGALNLGFIASHHYVRHETVELFASSIVPRTTLDGLLDILCFAWEFRDTPERDNEEKVLADISRLLPKDPVLEGNGDLSYSSPTAKAHILLQAHMNRVDVVDDLLEDKETVLLLSVRLLHAMVDVISSAGWMIPALEAIDLCQMLVQGVWKSTETNAGENSASLKQLPFMSAPLVATLQSDYDVDSIHSFFEMDDEKRAEALKSLKVNEIAQLTIAANSFPDIQFEKYSVERLSSEGDFVTTRLVMTLDRNIEETDTSDDPKSRASAPLYPVAVNEGWWLIVGDPNSNSLFSLKHISFQSNAKVKTTFERPKNIDETSINIYLLSDCYIGADLEEALGDPEVT